MRGRAAWPRFDLDAARFTDYVNARLRSDSAAADPSSLHIEDLYLACACVDGMAIAHRAFDEHHLALVPRHLARLDSTRVVADDVRQLLRERLLVAGAAAPPRLASYSGRGPLRAWVKVAAVRLALNLRRARDGNPRVADPDAAIVTATPELLLAQRRFRPQFDAALADAVSRLTVADRQLLRFCVVEGLSLAQIGALLELDKATISRRLAAARAQLLRRTQDHLRQQLGFATVEVDSLIRLLRSQLGDVSVARLLR
ncbi:MAG TPA: sigma factor-like helix-turn-helix DNA-binding protein [Polyangia bacterium]